MPWLVGCGVSAEDWLGLHAPYSSRVCKFIYYLLVFSEVTSRDWITSKADWAIGITLLWLFGLVWQEA